MKAISRFVIFEMLTSVILEALLIEDPKLDAHSDISVELNHCAVDSNAFHDLEVPLTK